MNCTLCVFAYYLLVQNVKFFGFKLRYFVICTVQFNTLNLPLYFTLRVLTPLVTVYIFARVE